MSLTTIRNSYNLQQEVQPRIPNANAVIQNSSNDLCGTMRVWGWPQGALMAQRRNNRNRKFTIFAIQLLPRIKTVADPGADLFRTGKYRTRCPRNKEV